MNHYLDMNYYPELGGFGDAGQLWKVGGADAGQSSGGGAGGTAIAANRQGRNGNEVWGMSSSKLVSAVVLTDLSPAQNHAISRFQSNLRSHIPIFKSPLYIVTLHGNIY
jgi:hypothetical protein